MKVMILGASGQLAREFQRQWRGRYDLAVMTVSDLDVSRIESVRNMVSDIAPDVLVNCAAYNSVDEAEKHPSDAFRVNALGPKNLAIAANDRGIPLVHFSTDYIFDGKLDRHYIEYDKPDPLGIYGRSKLAGELAVKDHTCRFYIVRVAWLAGRKGRNFVETMLELGADRKNLNVVNDQIGTPTFCPDVVRHVEKLLKSEQYGIYHMTGKGECTWYEYAKEIFRLAGMDHVSIEPVSTEEFARPASRPAYCVLDNMMLRLTVGDDMPPWQEGLEAYMSNRA